MFVKTMDKRTYYGVRLSENVIRDSNGQLIAANVPIARTGIQEYMGGELNEDLDQDKVYTVERLPEDVFEKGFIASLENKPFVDLHPDEDVVVGVNHTELAKGYMRDIKPGKLDVVGLEDKYYDEKGNNVLFADLVITDQDMIDFVESERKKPFNDRKIDLSLGYDAEYIQISDSGFKQVPKVGNHIARVPRGRAGVAKIRDNSAIDLTHNNEYFRQTLPWKFEGGLKKQGITKLKFVIMTPDEYYDELVYKAQTHFKDEVIPTDDEQIKSIINQLNNGAKMDIPYVIYNTTFEGKNDQDGRHRVEAMRRLGVQNVPVLILYKTKEAMKVKDNSIYTAYTKDIKGGWDKKDIPELNKQIKIAEKSIKELKEKEQSDSVKRQIKGFEETIKINNERLAIANKSKDEDTSKTKDLSESALNSLLTAVERLVGSDREQENLEKSQYDQYVKKLKEYREEYELPAKYTRRIVAAESKLKKIKVTDAATEFTKGDSVTYTKEYKFGKTGTETTRIHSIIPPGAKALLTNGDTVELKKLKKVNDEDKTKDSKPYKIKFKDATFEMHGFESKKEAKDYALIFHEIVRDATPEEILTDASRKINWASKGMGEGMKTKQKLSDNWKAWIKSVKNGNWDVARTVKELKKTFGTKDANPYDVMIDNVIKQLQKVNKQTKVTQGNAVLSKKWTETMRALVEAKGKDPAVGTEAIKKANELLTAMKNATKDVATEYVIKNKSGMYYIMSGSNNVIFSAKKKADRFSSKSHANEIANFLKTKEEFKKHVPFTVEPAE